MAKKKMRRSNSQVRRKRIDLNSEAIDLRNTELLKKFVTENGKILPRRVTGLNSKLHRKLTREIKRARNVLLIK